tara:strand:+ start:1845 stop:2060 length:216 start_codon:yes stop_codon:yes gene_type:complete
VIAPINVFELQKIKEHCSNLSSFIRSLDNHLRFDKNSDLGQVLNELDIMGARIDVTILEIDAFEQNELEMK